MTELSGEDPGFVALGQPAVQPRPVPTGWEFFLVPAGPTQQIVMARISTPTGIHCVFATADEMLDIAKKMESAALQCQSRIVVAERNLIVPPGVNGFDHH